MYAELATAHLSKIFHRRRRRMAASQRTVAEFKLVLVGDGGVGM